MIGQFANICMGTRKIFKVNSNGFCAAPFIYSTRIRGPVVLLGSTSPSTSISQQIMPVEAILGRTTRVKFTIGHTVLLLYNFAPRCPSDILTQLFEINAIIATITNFFRKTMPV